MRCGSLLWSSLLGTRTCWTAGRSPFPRLHPSPLNPTPPFREHAGVRLLRRFTGMKAANGDAVSRFMGRWTAAMFQGVHLLHEALRPLLGCGLEVGK